MLERILLLCALAAPLAAPAPPAPAPAPQSGAGLSDADEWYELLERDARVSFPSTARSRALIDIENRDLPSAQRALALVALGAAKAPHADGVLEARALEGTDEERRAAVFGLGELGPGEVYVLQGLVERESEDLARAALIALQRTNSPAARAFIAALAERPEQPLSGFAAELGALGSDPAASEPIADVRDYLQLRWDAARAYGLIDGRSWQSWLREVLDADEEFLDALVFRGAARLHQAGISDHYVDALFDHAGLQRVRGAVAHMPSEFARLVTSGLWKPANQREWSAAIVEIDLQHAERACRDMLRTIRLVPGLSTYAAVLLVRAGSAEGLPLVELDLLSADPARRALVVRTLGDSGLKRYIATLEPLLADADARVRAETLVALSRLEHDASMLRVQELLRDTAGPEFPALVGALTASVRHPAVQADLVDLLPRLTGDLRLQTPVAAALAQAGKIGPPRWILRTALEAGAGGQDAVSMVRALAQGADQAELGFLRDQFPVQDHFELNVELALALVQNRDPSILSLLRSALWKSPRSRSLLAAALIVDIDGIDSLRSELSKPPAASSQADLRRVGFALGQWGGLEEVERLARRSRASDPALQGALLGALASRTF